MPLYERLDGCQKKAVRLAIRHKGACIFFEQGVGKTHPTVSIIEEVLSDTFTGFGVVKLSNIDTTWRTLIKKEIPQLGIYGDWDQFKKAPCPKLFLINYEGVNKKLRDKMGKFKWTLGFFDESQQLKSRGTASSRLGAAIKNCEYRLCLSGTPLDGDEIHFFGQLRFAAPQLYGNDRSAWKRFDNRFLKPTGYMGYKRKFRIEMLPVFLREIQPYIIRVEADDVLDLPGMTTIKVRVPLLGEQSRVYRVMERDMVVRIIAEAKEKAAAKEKRTGRKVAVRVSAGLKITHMVKLQQICGGHVIDDNGELQILRSAKLRKLKYLLKKRVEYPVAIFCKFTHERKEIEKLLKSLDISFTSIHGGVKDKKGNLARSNAQRAFQSGKVKAIVCQVRAGGVGIDLFAARSAIVYSTTFSYIDYEQLKKRIKRRGQLNPTTLFFLYAENTIDEDIYSRILSKRSVSKSVFNTMKQRSLRNGQSGKRDQGKESRYDRKDEIRRRGRSGRSWHRTSKRSRTTA